MGRIVLGVDLSTVPPVFPESVPGRALILDADGAAYRAAATAKTLPTVVKRFITEVLTMQFLTGAAEIRLHLTASKSEKAGRDLYPAAKPYQGNRKGKAKPALLEPLRELLGDPAQAAAAGVPDDWYINLNRYWEADDTMIQDAMVYGANGVIVSDDKDLRMTPGPYWEASQGRVSTIEGRFGYLKESYTEAGALRIKGHGTKFFWCQMLMGDAADNIQGIKRLYGKLCGPAGAFDFLRDYTDEDACANAVLAAYADAGQDPLAEAQLLWLRRTVDDCAYRYLTELNLRPDIRRWLDELHQYHNELIAYKRAEYDQG